MITATTDIQYLKGVGEKRAVVLKKKGIDTVGALLRYYPRDYLDWTDIKKISSAPLFEKVCIKAKVLRVEAEKKRNGMPFIRSFARTILLKWQPFFSTKGFWLKVWERVENIFFTGVYRVDFCSEKCPLQKLFL